MSRKTRTYRPSELAAELNVDPKKLRGYLRKTHTRKANEHNTSWTISEQVAKDVRAHFKANAPKVASKPKRTNAPKPKPVAKVAPAVAPIVPSIMQSDAPTA